MKIFYLKNFLKLDEAYFSIKELMTFLLFSSMVTKFAPTLVPFIKTTHTFALTTP